MVRALRWAVLLLAVGGTAAAQTVPPGGVGYYGSSATQPFNEKALFPPPGAAPPPAAVVDHPPTLIPDGSLPPPPPPKLWTGGFEFGLNGSEGNTDVLNVRFGLNADRRTARNTFHTDFLYTLTRDGDVFQNQALLNLRDELLFPDSPWSVFTAAQVEYDAFRAYDFRAGTYAGLSYRVIRTETTLLKTRVGAGAAYELDTSTGGRPDRWVPEAILGADFNRRLTDRQGLVSSVDVYPNLSQIGQYRVRARVGYEIVVDPSHGMVLRLGVQDRYDSDPGEAKRNDLNFFVTLLFKF